MFCTTFHCFSNILNLAFLQILSTVSSATPFIFSSFFLHLKMASWCLSKLNSKWQGEKPSLLLTKSYCADRNISLPLSSHLICREGWSWKLYLWKFYLFQRINKKKQECKGENILIRVSEHTTVNDHIMRLKKDQNPCLSLISFAGVNCIFHSRKLKWQGFLSQSHLR